MSLPKINPTTTRAWQQLRVHFDAVKNVHVSDLFERETARKENYTLKFDDFLVDFSRNRITSKTKSLLNQLANEVGLEVAIKAQFAGETINETEGRQVLHTALRDFDDMKPEVADALAKMKTFSEEISSGAWKGYSGKPIKTIVNIGIGGSDLGPAMVTEALAYYRNNLELHFISNVDGDSVAEVLKKVSLEETLFIIVSKTFTTQETLANAQTVRKWFVEQASEEAVSKHFVAVSTHSDAVSSFGIKQENTFPMWNWVGGRFSLWSTVGLSICCAIGYANFEELLQGAQKMDMHFSTTDFEQNIPVQMALISIWYNNFFECETEVVLPYTQYLSKFVPYLQQAVMESNGKRIDRNGDFVDYQTGTIVWGSTGTNAQHAFFQLLHQGTKMIPSDFVCFTDSLHGNQEHQAKLLANCYAQVDALAFGTHGVLVENTFKYFKGNQPTNLIEIDKLTPSSLGSLIALYEHKLFVQGIVWNIFSFDQWGVELGKKMASDLLKNNNL